ncbi:MAG: membrane dipeptidase [Oscillospiraceae bacterium]
MNPPGMIDLHCDTLTNFLRLCVSGDAFKAALQSKATRADMLARIAQYDTLDDSQNMLSLSKIPRTVHWAECCAIFIPDEFRGPAAVEYFEVNRRNYDRQMNLFSDAVIPCHSGADIDAAFASGKFAFLLTVEGGAVLDGKLSNVAWLANAGVRMLTLVWNGVNELGSGHSNPEMGLTAFGKAAIPVLERNGILIDTSHLNDAGFDDLCAIASRPFVASHSNARGVAAHKRNLPDGHITEFVRRRGLIGLNFHTLFLCDDGLVSNLDVLYRHIIYFLERGAEDCLALGSDYDGATLPVCLNSVEKALSLYDYLLSRGLSQRTVDGILFQNALRFFKENLQ